MSVRHTTFERTCLNCHTQFHPWLSAPYHEGLFCSRACVNAYKSRPNAVCQYCHASYKVKQSHLHRSHYCSRVCKHAGRKLFRAADFWHRVQRCSHETWCPYCCWPWLAGCTGAGYGQFKRGVKYPAHRLAWNVFNNQIMLADLFACHWCNTRTCCNPLHIYAGTPAQNTQQASREGRMPFGEGNASAKLTESQVLEIRLLAAQGYSRNQLARLFGVSKPAIKNIVLRRTWKHLSSL